MPKWNTEGGGPLTARFLAGAAIPPTRAAPDTHLLQSDQATFRPERSDPRIPTGFRPPAQGCAPGATLGNASPIGINPNGVVANQGTSGGRVTTPLGLMKPPTTFPG